MAGANFDNDESKVMEASASVDKLDAENQEAAREALEQKMFQTCDEALELKEEKLAKDLDHVLNPSKQESTF